MQQNILVIQLGALREFMYALGSMAAIRRHHTDAKISLLTTEPFAQMAQDCGYFDEILVDHRPKLYDIFGWVGLRSILNAAEFSRVYDLQHNHRTALYSKLFSPKPEWISGREALKDAGVYPVEPDRLEWLGDNISAFGVKAPYVLISSGGFANHLTRQWAVEKFRILIGKMILHGFHPVLVGSKEDQPTNDQVARGIVGLINLTGRTRVADIPPLARGALAGIGNDTDIMHIAAITGCPVVMISDEMQSPLNESGVKALKIMDLKNSSPQSVWTKFQEFLEEYKAFERKADSDSQSYQQLADG